MNHSLNVSSRCSKHESITRNRMHPLNQRRSWIFFFTDFKWFWFFLLFKSLFWWNPYGFLGLQRLIHVVNHEILYGFEIFLGFQFFWTKFYWTPTDLHWFRLVDVLEYEWGKFRFSPVFYSEIWTGIFKISSILILFVDFVAWIPKINRWFLSSSSPVQNLWNSFPLLLNFFPLWSYWVRRFQWWIQCLNCRGKSSMMKIQPWISES